VTVRSRTLSSIEICAVLEHHGHLQRDGILHVAINQQLCREAACRKWSRQQEQTKAKLPLGMLCTDPYGVESVLASANQIINQKSSFTSGGTKVGEHE